MHVECLPYNICVPSLVLIAQVVFLLERGHKNRPTHKVTDATDLPSHAVRYAGVANECDEMKINSVKKSSTVPRRIGFCC